MFGFCIEMYIIANCWPVPLTITGSLEASGKVPRTPCTLDSTSVSAMSGLEPSLMLHRHGARDGRLGEVT